MNKAESLLDEQLDELLRCSIPADIKRLNKDEAYVEISFEGKRICDILETDISFLIQVGPNFPYRPPRVFCLTQFCLPGFADGRDILEDILNDTYKPDLTLIQIIEKMPLLIADYIERLREGTVVFCGIYHLGEKYDTNILQNLPVVFKTIKQRITVENKEKTIERFLLVSDLNICLFDDDKWTLKNSATLVFWASVRSVLQIKRSIDENLVRFVFKEKYKKENHTLVFEIDNDTDEIISSILNVLKILGIGFNKVNKNAPKTGEIPKIDIEMVEFNIKQLESIIGENEAEAGVDELQMLMDFYQKGIEFYSATNDPKYETYLARLTTLMKVTSNHKKLKEESKESSLKQPSVSRNKEEMKKMKEESKEIKVEKKEENLIKPGEPKKPAEKSVKVKSSETKTQPHLTNQEGIVIDDSDLPAFDDGNESPDSDS